MKKKKKENPVPLMELELRKMNKINKSKKQNNYISNVNPLDIIKGEKEVQVLKMELISELDPGRKDMVRVDAQVSV